MAGCAINCCGRMAEWENRQWFLANTADGTFWAKGGDSPNIASTVFDYHMSVWHDEKW
jgi:hypothetical protein